MEPTNKQITHSLPKRLVIVLREHYMVPLLVFLFILSLFIPRTELSLSSTTQVLYIALIVIALLYILILCLISDDSKYWDLEVIFMLIFAFDLIIRFTGGITSFLLPLFFLLIIAAAYYFKFFYTLAGIGLIFALHIPWIELIQNRTLTIPSLKQLLIVLGFLTAAAGLVKVISWNQSKKYTQLVDEIARMKSSLEQLEVSSAEEPLSPLSVDEQLSRSAAFITEMDRVLKDIMVLIRKSFGGYSAFLWQYHHPTKQLLLRSYDTLSKHFSSKVALELNEGIYRKVAEKGPFIFRAKRQFPPKELRYYGGREKIIAIAAAPIKDKEELIGILAVDTKAAEGFTNQQLLFLSHFAAHIVDLINLYRQARNREQEAQEIRAFYQAAQKLASYINLGDIMDQLIKLARNIADFQTYALVLLSRDQFYYIIKRIEGLGSILKDAKVPNDGNTWLSWFIRNQKEPLVISNFKDESREMPLISPQEGDIAISSFVALSLMVKDSPLGALILGGKEKNQFSGNEARMLSILCSQASLALENALIHQRIGRMAITDGLTELYNHRYFQEILSREIIRQKRIGGTFSLLLIDIDDFKKLNDEYGHQVGDFVLKGIATILKKEAREADVHARYGGEEFALLLIDSDKKGSMKTGERICKSVEEQEFRIGERIVNITISGGIAVWPADAKEKKLLIKKADKALYYSKAKGKNRISHISQVKGKK